MPACLARGSTATSCAQAIQIANGLWLGSPTSSSSGATLQLNLSGAEPGKPAGAARTRVLSEAFDSAMCAGSPIEIASERLGKLGASALSAFTHAFRARLKDGNQSTWAPRVDGLSDVMWTWPTPVQAGEIYAHPVFKLARHDLSSSDRDASQAVDSGHAPSPRTTATSAQPAVSRRDEALLAILRHLSASVRHHVFPLIASLMERGLGAPSGAIGADGLIFERAVVHYYNEPTPARLLLSERAFHVDDDLFTLNFETAAGLHCLRASCIQAYGGAHRVNVRAITHEDRTQPVR